LLRPPDQVVEVLEVEEELPFLASVAEGKADRDKDPFVDQTPNSPARDREVVGRPLDGEKASLR
jgi:hypothetical protein